MVVACGFGGMVVLFHLWLFCCLFGYFVCWVWYIGSGLVGLLSLRLGSHVCGLGWRFMVVLVGVFVFWRWLCCVLRLCCFDYCGFVFCLVVNSVAFSFFFSFVCICAGSYSVSCALLLGFPGLA